MNSFQFELITLCWRHQRRLPLRDIKTALLGLVEQVDAVIEAERAADGDAVNQAAKNLIS